MVVAQPLTRILPNSSRKAKASFSDNKYIRGQRHYTESMCNVFILRAWFTLLQNVTIAAASVKEQRYLEEKLTFIYIASIVNIIDRFGKPRVDEVER